MVVLNKTQYMFTFFHKYFMESFFKGVCIQSDTIEIMNLKKYW